MNTTLNRNSIINAHFTNHFGGAHNRIIRSAKRLSELGYEVEFCLPSSPGRAADIARRHEMKVTRLDFTPIENVKGMLGILRLLLLMPRDIVVFFKYFRGHKANIVHISGGFFISPALAAKAAGKRIVWHLNDTVMNDMVARILGFLVKHIADVVIAQGVAVGDFYHLAPDEYCCVYSLVDTDVFSMKRNDKSARRSFRVGLIATRNPMKGMDYFIRAVELLQASTNEKVEGVLAGARLDSQPAYAQKIDALIDVARGSVDFENHEFVEEPEKLLASLSALVMASPYGDACPNIVLEAMASGVPVVSVKTGSVDELLAPETTNEAGLVVRKADASAIYMALRELMNDPARARKMGLNGARRAKDEFSVGHYCELHAKIYDQLLG